VVFTSEFEIQEYGASEFYFFLIVKREDMIIRKTVHFLVFIINVPIQEFADIIDRLEVPLSKLQYSVTVLTA
jgi:hypothetical protein